VNAEFSPTCSWRSDEDAIDKTQSAAIYREVLTRFFPPMRFRVNAKRQSLVVIRTRPAEVASDASRCCLAEVLAGGTSPLSQNHLFSSR